MSGGGIAGLLCAVATVAALALAVATGAMPAACNPPRHLVQLSDVGRHTACVAGSPAPAARRR